jgi:hypothetical protein
MSCYEDRFILLNVNVRISQETHLGASTACYGIALLFHMQIILVPHGKQTYRPQGPVTEMSLLVYISMIFGPHMKHIYPPLRPVTGILFFCFNWWMMPITRCHQ